jgi:hypothetical protein
MVLNLARTWFMGLMYRLFVEILKFVLASDVVGGTISQSLLVFSYVKMVGLTENNSGEVYFVIGRMH